MDKPLNSKANILIVDDDVLIAESNKFILKKAGYNIAGIATEGLQAIKLAKEKQPDLILMDVNLGSSMDGITAAEEIQKFADIPFIFLTAYSDNATIERAKKVGPFGYLIKPFDNRELIIALETSLYKHSFEKKTKEQELLFRTVANFAYEWEFWLSPDLQFKYCSPSCQRITGYGSEEFTSNPKLIFDIVHPDDKNAFEKHIQDNYHGEKDGVVTDYQFRIIDKQGAVKFISHTCSSIFDDKNNYLGRRGTNVDITERKIAEEQIREANLGLQLAIEGGELGTFDADITNGKVRVNDRYLIMLGYSPDEIEVTSKFWTTLIHPEDLQKVLDLSNKIESGEIKEMETEYRVKHKSGNWIWLRDKAKGFDYDSSGKPARSAGTHRDITTKKQAEEALRQSEDRFKQVSENASEWIWEVDANGLYTYASHVVKELLGYTTDEIIGKKYFYDLFDETDKEQLKHAAFIAFESKDRFNNFININRHKNGRKVILSTSGVPILDKDGTLVGYRGVDVDITEQKQAEEALRQSEETFRELYEQSPVGYQSLDDEGRFITVNDVWVNILGYQKEEVLGKWFGDFLAPEYVEPFRERFPLFKAEGKIHSEFYMMRKNGERVYIAFEGRIGYKPSGEFRQTHCVLSDQTERKLFEESLKKQKEEFETIFNLVPAQIWHKDAYNNFIKVNRQVCEDIGLPNDEIEGHSAEELFPSFAKQYYEDDLEVINSGKPKLGISEQVNTASGELRWVHTDKVPVFGKDGKVNGLIAFTQDITERKQAEEALRESEQKFRSIFDDHAAIKLLRVKSESELKKYREHLEELVETRTEELDKLNVDLREQLQKEKGLEMMLRKSLGKEKELNELKTRFISTASHEFRTPLTTVLASAEMIQRYGKKWSEEKYNEYINKIKKSVSYLTKLMDDVLTISRSESGKIQFNPDMVNLYKLCTEIIEETRSNTNAKHDFVFNFSMRKIKYHLDPNLIKFILTNLLSNAFKYSPEGGKIELSVSSKKDNIEITVADEGIGIPGEDIIHLFEPFHRSANTVEIPGTGLGLSIVKHAIELHKGKITVKSELGKGTTFTVDIPKRKK